MYKDLERSMADLEINKSFAWEECAFKMERIWGVEGWGYARFEGSVRHPNGGVSQLTHICVFVNQLYIFIWMHNICMCGV